MLRWTIYQNIVLFGLVGLAVVADQFKMVIAVPMITSTEQIVLTFSFIIITVALISLLFFFQVKKSETFLIHPVWYKMHKIIIALFVLSIVIFIGAVNPVTALVENYRFTFYIIVYYFIFLTNLLILIFVHKNHPSAMSNEKKVSTAFWWTCVVFVVLNFMLA